MAKELKSADLQRRHDQKVYDQVVRAKGQKLGQKPVKGHLSGSWRKCAVCLGMLKGLSGDVTIDGKPFKF